MTWALFNALGEVDFNTEQSNFMQEDRETRQYVSLASLKRNLPKVFGIRNDFFSFLLFNYLSNHAPLNYIINYNQFLFRFMRLWPKKREGGKHENENQKEIRLFHEKKARRLQIHSLLFDILRISNKEDVTIFDLL